MLKHKHSLQFTPQFKGNMKKHSNHNRNNGHLIFISTKLLYCARIFVVYLYQKKILYNFHIKRWSGFRVDFVIFRQKAKCLCWLFYCFDLSLWWHLWGKMRVGLCFHFDGMEICSAQHKLQKLIKVKSSFTFKD